MQRSLGKVEIPMYEISVLATVWLLTHIAKSGRGSLYVEERESCCWTKKKTGETACGRITDLVKTGIANDESQTSATCENSIDSNRQLACVAHHAVLQRSQQWRKHFNMPELRCEQYLVSIEA